MVKEAGVVQILFASRSILLQRLDDLGFALIEGLFAGLPDIEIDQDFVISEAGP